ncbi:MAG: RluA family pseudouridine synthase [Aerococcus suis]|nr:RluA family pseudouridine synthase [Aerococcus suis]MDD7759025.1 RluA family pseudouridine synthase [Aerococcus suis]
MLKFEWRVEKEQRLKKFLQQQGISRRLLARIKFHGGHLLVNHEPATVKTPLKIDDLVTVYLPPEGTQDIITPIDKEIDILFEDDHYIAINKPAGFTSIPSQYNPQGSLANMLKAYYQKQQYENQVIHVVTRLDRDTSGVMLFAKHAYAHGLIDRELQSQRIVKQYWAFTEQPINQDKHGYIDEPIGRSPHSIIERQVTSDGKPALTEYWLKGQLQDSYQYQVQLHTGRTHQIRVHFAYEGAPLIGDDLYGGPLRPTMHRQALHCKSLSFNHPITKETIYITAPLPEDLLPFNTIN